jgi:hypothetical protein
LENEIPKPLKFRNLKLPEAFSLGKCPKSKSPETFKKLEKRNTRRANSHFQITEMALAAIYKALFSLNPPNPSLQVGLPLTMAEQETSVRVTRAAKKRAATATADEQAPTKKRVVLGELPNLSNVIVPANPGSGAGPQKPKCKTKTKKVTKSATTAAVKPAGTAEKDTNSKPDDPQMCEPYVSEIYEYLHKMEVSGPQLLFRLVC